MTIAKPASGMILAFPESPLDSGAKGDPGDLRFRRLLGAEAWNRFPSASARDSSSGSPGLVARPIAARFWKPG